MRALVVTKYGTPAEMGIQERPMPQPGEGQALVRVRAAAANPLDVTVRAGYFPIAKQPPIVLGNEGAGVVESGTKFAKGTKVIISGGFLGVGEDGTMQEYIAVPESYLAPLPDNFSFEEGAGFAVGFLTAHAALTYGGGLQAGEWVAVPGAAGSVGNAAVQLAKALGARPIAIVSTAQKAAQVAAFEPAGIVDLSKEDLAEGVARVSGGHGADIAIDPVGGSVTGLLLHSLAPNGRLVSLGYTNGTQASINVLDLIAKPSKLVGFNLFTVPGEVVSASFGALLGLANQGKIKVPVDSTYPLEQAEVAFARLASRKAAGKVVISL